MQVTCWARWAVFIIVGTSLQGGAPPSLYQQFEAADVVIVGKATATRRIWNFFSSHKTRPRAAIDYEPTYTCAITIEVGDVLKAQASEVKSGGNLSVIWYLPKPDCAPKIRENYNLLNHEALWLLRNENGTLRVLVDNHFTAYLIENFSADTQRGLAQWRNDPGAALTYLAVKPGVLVPEGRYPGSSLPIDIIPLVGMMEYLKVFRSVYLESTNVQRGLISLEVSSLGFCLASARRFSESNARFRSAGSEVSFFLNPQSERANEETYLSKMEGGTKDTIENAFGGSKEARDELIKLSCWRTVRVRARARELLSKFFSIDPSTIPCIPCE